MSKMTLLFFVVSVVFILSLQTVFAYNLGDLVNYLQNLFYPSSQSAIVGGTLFCQNCNLANPILSPSTPSANQVFYVTCPASAPDGACTRSDRQCPGVIAYTNYNGYTGCPFVDWTSQGAKFSCLGHPAGTWTVSCKLISQVNSNEACWNGLKPCDESPKSISFTVQGMTTTSTYPATTTTKKSTTTTTIIIPTTTTTTTSCRRCGLQLPTINPSSPNAGSNFEIICPATDNSGACRDGANPKWCNGVVAYTNYNGYTGCSFMNSTGWTSQGAKFSCLGHPAGDYTAYCKILSNQLCWSGLTCGEGPASKTFTVQSTTTTTNVVVTTTTTRRSTTTTKPTTTTKSYCNDSDGGQNYLTKGTCKDSTGSFADRCSSDGSIQEYYCDVTGSLCNYGTSSCDYLVGSGYICSNGACVKQGTTTTTTTPTSKCVRANPGVFASLSPQEGDAGETLSYEVTVVNDDTTECGPSTFSVTAEAPLLWSASSSSLVVDPKSYGEIKVFVTSWGWADPGDYNIKVSAINQPSLLERYEDTDNVIYRIKTESPVPSGLLGTFYYPWYGSSSNEWHHWNGPYNQHSAPNTWYSNYIPDKEPGQFDPSKELYDSNDYETFKWQLDLMKRAGIQFAISSWWGKGDNTNNAEDPYPDKVFRKILLDFMKRPDNPFYNEELGLLWTIYYEKEGSRNPDENEIKNDLQYITNNYCNDEHYFRIDGKCVIFVYADENDRCNYLEKWNSVRNSLGNVYIVLKIFPGYDIPSYCGSGLEVDGWHEYAPALPFQDDPPNYAFISPGFWKPDEQPRLIRSSNEFAANAQKFKESSAKFKLIETWNEYNEGTQIEPSQEVGYDNSLGVFTPSKNSFGTFYVDSLGYRANKMVIASDICQAGGTCSSDLVGECSEGIWIVKNKEGKPLTTPVVESIPPGKIEYTPAHEGKTNVISICFEPKIKIQKSVINVY